MPERVVTGQISTLVSAKYFGTRSDSQLGSSWFSFRYASTAALIISRFFLQTDASFRSVEGLYSFVFIVGEATATLCVRARPVEPGRRALGGGTGWSAS